MPIGYRIGWEDLRTRAILTSPSQVVVNDYVGRCRISPRDRWIQMTFYDRKDLLRQRKLVIHDSGCGCLLPATRVFAEDDDRRFVVSPAQMIR